MIHPQEARDKQLLAWERERNMLQKRLSDPPVLPLAQPIQQGWKRHFVFTPEAKARPDAGVLADILKRIDTVVYYWRRDFQLSRRQARCQRRTFSNEQFLRAVPLHAWEGGGYDEYWRKYFLRELVPYGLVFRPEADLLRHQVIREHLWPDRFSLVPAYVFRYPRLFDLKIERHWLTHVKQLEPEVVTRVAELGGYIQRRGGEHRLDWLHGHSFRRWNSLERRVKILRRLAAQEIREALDDLAASDPRLSPQTAVQGPGVGRAAVTPTFHISNTINPGKDYPHASTITQCFRPCPRRARPRRSHARRARALRLRKRQPRVGFRLAG